MDKKFAMKWAKALESGKYHQTKGQLFNGKGYCCLGVACILGGAKFEKNSIGNYVVQGTDENLNLPDSIRNIMGMKHCGGFYDDKNFHHTLPGLNDDEGRKFKTIAKYIRQYWEQL